MQKITKAVIPAAGLGTRFLPATKAMPKEMLPVVDKPAIQYVVEEAVAAGLEHVLMITGRNKTALENHFDRVVELETALEDIGDQHKLEVIDEATRLADIHYVRQGDPNGLGHAVSKAETFAGTEPFALLLGDDLIGENESLLRDMLTIAQDETATVVALMEVPADDVSRYGVAEVDFEAGAAIGRIHGFVEKPDRHVAPSNYAVIGRYVLQPSIFDALRETSIGFGGEIQLTDALELMSKNSDQYGPVIGYQFAGRRYDTGDKLSYLKAIVEIARQRDDLGAEFSSWLKTFAPTEVGSAD